MPHVAAVYTSEGEMFEVIATHTTGDPKNPLNYSLTFFKDGKIMSWEWEEQNITEFVRHGIRRQLKEVL